MILIIRNNKLDSFLYFLNRNTKTKTMKKKQVQVYLKKNYESKI